MASRPVRSLSMTEVKAGDVIRWGPSKRWALVREVRRRPFWVTWVLVWAFGHNAGQPCTPDGLVHRRADLSCYVAKDPLDARKLHKQLGWSETGQKVASTPRAEAASLLHALGDVLDSDAAAGFDVETSRTTAHSVEYSIKVWTSELVQP